MSDQLRIDIPKQQPTYVDQAWFSRMYAFIPRELSMRERVSWVIETANGSWVCGSYFYGSFMPTFSQRISELVAEGRPIERGRCHDPNHNHNSSLGAYRWVE